jgi:two-component system LytT family response regulator
MTEIRTLVVDDEPLTRERIGSLVRETDGLTLVGEARNGLEALDMIAAHSPQLLFIDVEMPELDGFGVVRALDVERAPAVIFVTAYETYAVQAFDVGAIDYLHKPVTTKRFEAAVARAKDRLERPSAANWRAVIAAAALAERSRGARPRFVVKQGNTHYFVPVEQVDWIDAADNYLRLHASGKVHFFRGTMKEAEDELDPRVFTRIHRSAIVAVDRIRSIRGNDSGGHIVEMRDGTKLRSSRHYVSRVKSLLR